MFKFYYHQLKQLKTDENTYENFDGTFFGNGYF